MQKNVALAVMVAVVAAVGASSSLAAGSAASVQVTSSNDSGPGSFRAAIEKANADTSVGRIVFRHGLGPVMLADPVVYTGGQSLDILGNGAVLDGSGLAPVDSTAFLADGGGNLSIALLTVRNAPQQGLTYEVPTVAAASRRSS